MFYAANTIFIYKSDKPIQFNAPEKDLYKLELEMKWIHVFHSIVTFEWYFEQGIFGQVCTEGNHDQPFTSRL